MNGLCCDDTTSQPIVPDISIAMLISAAPRRISFEAMIRSSIEFCLTSSVDNPLS
ncbi:hypothetical protein [Paraburkholderia kirstenboschensis]|uniref:hypothetical protein n=1 Tax=Paraburkholderia kirstenboschensis TaxID=1245436 RepID=UPI001FB46E97|nr:hypothetical protein [Paraburkholderia kirstenboschensis]